MALPVRQRNVSIPADNELSVPADPSSLTRLLRAHRGFVGQADDLIESAVLCLCSMVSSWTLAP